MLRQTPPLILCFASNLMFLTRLESAAKMLEYRIEFISHADELGPPEMDQCVPERPIAEQMVGRAAVLMDRVTRMRPALIVWDLDSSEIPWKSWLPLIKSAPATRRIPLICYAPHVDLRAFQDARDRGADAVYARSRFFGDLATLIKKHANPPNYLAIDAACQKPLSKLAMEGIRLFNEGEYFEAHEELELAWNAEEPPGRELYQGILQIAVAYLQITRKNYNGAQKMFLRARQWLDPLPGVCRGINIDQFRQDVAFVQRIVTDLGPSRLQDFSLTLLKPILFVS
jgi:hypothetical protein